MKTHVHVLALGLCSAVSTTGATALELTTNGGFEAGDTSEWVDFLVGTQTFAVTHDANTGSFAGEIYNAIDGLPAVVKQANLGVGVVMPGETITISFSAMGEGMIGGVAFAEFFSEIDGGGTSSSEILGGAPLFPPSDTFQDYSFTTTAGPDVSGGVTLQFNAVAAANIGSTSRLIIDDVSVSIVRDELALVGDYNSDGFVSQGDLDLILLNWGDASAPAGYDETAVDGGGPFDGQISQNELDSVLLNWGSGTAPNLSAVPEPVSLAMLGLGGLTLAGRRRGSSGLL